MSSSHMADDTIDAWMTREAIACSLDQPDSCEPAIDRVMQALGDPVDLLGFGEALHGGEELLRLRNRLFQRLVERHGFSALAIESSFPRALVVNDYVAGRGPASYEAIRDSGFGVAFGGLEANREIVEWMRAYNADSAHDLKLRFYGFDIPTGPMGIASPRQVLMIALDDLATLGAKDGQRRARIEALLGPDNAWENPAALADPSQSIGATPDAIRLRSETEDLIAALRARAPELAARDEPRYAEALHAAIIARQLLAFHAAIARENDQGERLGIRDTLMADNLGYILGRERGRGKVLVFAHNGHLQRGMAAFQIGPERHTWWPAGAHLAAALGPRYAVIGTAVGVSEANGIGRPEPGTLEARLTATPGPVRFLPTHGARGLSPAELAALPARSGSATNPTYIPLTAQCFSDFDWLAVVDSTGYNRGGAPLSDWDASTSE